MADFVVVGGVPIKVSPSSGKTDWNDATDRRRSFDNTYRASATGGAARDWHFSTPPITRAVAGTYRAVLSQVQAQMCSGEGLELPTMCCAELIGETPVKGAASNYVSLDFALHESASKRLLLKYAPGDTITGESFTRSTTATYRDSNGIVATAAINVKRAAHYPVTGTPNTPYLLLEDARTNAALWCKDLTNAVWVKTTMTTATTTGADGVAASATRLTATAGNATVSQSVTLGSSARYMSAYVKRVTGSGTIQMTTDAVGADWQTIVVTAGWTRLEIPTKTLANPNFGFRIVTNGDAIDVDFVQNENGTFASSAIPTTTVAVTRGADSYSLPFTAPPQEMSVYAKFVEGGSILVNGSRIFEVSSAAGADARFLSYNASGPYSAFHGNGSAVTSPQVPAPAMGQTVEFVARLFGDGSVDSVQSINGTAATFGAQSAALALASTWSGSLVWLNSEGTIGGIGFTAIQQFKIVAGSRSLAEMRVA